MRKSNKYLGAEDLMGLGRVTVEIETVFEFEDEVLQDGRKKSGNSLGLKGKKKRVIVNATNRRILVACFGEFVDNWIGQKFQIVAANGKKNPAGGAPVWGLDFIAVPNPELLKAKRAEMNGGAA